MRSRIRSLPFAGASLAAGLSLAAAFGQSEPSPTRGIAKRAYEESLETGELTAKLGTKLILTLPGGRVRGCVVEDSTRITLDGRIARLSQLHEGDRVQARFDGNRLRLLAATRAEKISSGSGGTANAGRSSR